MSKTANMYLADRFLNEVRKQISIEKYIEEDCGLRLFKISDNKYKRSCPFHSEKQPSFVVYVETQSTYCFGCKKSHNILKFAKEYNSWTWKETIDYFSNRLGISHEINNSDMAELVFTNYVNRCSGTVDDLDPIGVDSFISKECKRIYRHFPNSIKLNKWIEKIYETTDKIILEEDKGNLYKLKYQIMPIIKQYEEECIDKQKALDNLHFENKFCYSCQLRYSCENIKIGFGNILSSIIFIDDFPKENSFIEIFKLIQEPYKIYNFWFDYIVSCQTSKEIKNEFNICKLRWLDKKIEIISPKIIITTNKNAYDIVKQYKNIEIYCCEDQLSDINKNEIKQIIEKFSNQ